MVLSSRLLSNMDLVLEGVLKRVLQEAQFYSSLLRCLESYSMIDLDHLSGDSTLPKPFDPNLSNFASAPFSS